jgi:ATP-dependent Clp protease protease subunit
MHDDDEDEDMPEHETAREGAKRVNDRIDLALLEKRRVFLSDTVTSETAKEVIRKLWYLEHIAPGKPILFVINSPGGSVDAGFAIWDTVKMISSPVVTLVTGLAASMGSLLSLVAGKGKRLSTPNARIMLHQPLINGVIRGQATDLDIQAKEMLKTRALLVGIYAEATGKTDKEIEKTIDRDNWMTPQEAKEFGLLDKIVSSMKEVDALLK